jgi:hypothetical protein
MARERGHIEIRPRPELVEGDDEEAVELASSGLLADGVGEEQAR